MGRARENHSDAPQTQGLSQGTGAQTTAWLDALNAKGQKWLRLTTLAGELPGINREQWLEIVVAFSQRVVAFEVGEA